MLGRDYKITFKSISETPFEEPHTIIIKGERERSNKKKFL